MPYRRRAVALALALSTLASSSSPMLATSDSSASFDLSASLRDLGLNVLERALALTPMGGSPVDDGPDGRLTVLLLGSDQRPGLQGERLDVIIVASHNASTDKVSFASIPRDTIGFPRAGGGTSGNTRVNQMFRDYRSGSCSKDCALKRFRSDVERALHIDIDYYVYIKFSAFDALVDNVGGIRVNTPGKLVDKWYMDEPTLPKGVWFPDDSNFELRGLSTPYCRTWKSSAPACHRAIVYVRSRKGTVGGRVNSDYRRSDRQQQVVFAAIERVLRRGDGPALSGLRSAVASRDDESGRATFATDMPTHSSTFGLAMYNRLSGASLGPNIVFKPTKFATASGATIRLKLSVVRNWIDAKMSPTGP